ncbi:MAG: NADH-quinone oxidoreductase subunit K [Deltaproteobacteria bacterium]|nr:NADH-quinone oxidoreductase subunit K [Deltaproteobacteria bacterium]MCX7952145.1 NADH-quinone oxidoreductase subunit K [Deltaproteobacteria bacterium]
MVKFVVAFLISSGLGVVFLKKNPLLMLLGLELCLNGVILAIAARYSQSNFEDDALIIAGILFLFCIAVIETVILATLQLKLKHNSL